MGWDGNIPYDNGCIGYQAVNGWRANRDDQKLPSLKLKVHPTM